MMTAMAAMATGDWRTANGSARAAHDRRGAPTSDCTGACLTVAISISNSDAGIEQPVQDVDDEVDQHVDGGHDNADPHDGREIERGRALEGIEPQTRPGKDALGDDRTGEEPTEAQ